MRTRVVLVLSGALLGSLLLPAPAQALIRPDTACRAGRVALTFDDGPHHQHTPRLLRVLRRHHAQVTFYVQGHRAAEHPKLLRQMVRDGHAVENHSWDHPRLTQLSDAAVRDQLVRTTRAIRDATGRRPKFFRPPYGLTDERIERIAGDVGLRRQLWTIDTADWNGRSAAQISRAALQGLRPHRRNVILMHDGVGNSARTVDAVADIVRGARARGFCLAPQQRMMARQKVRVVARRLTEPRAASVEKKVVLRLNSPAQRNGRVRVTAVDGTARAGVHYRRAPVWVRFKRGQDKAIVSVRLLRAADDSADRTFRLRLSDPRRLRIAPGRRATEFVIANR